jgi:two-component system phosphate regulon sensor histidine kinase PhoR
MNRLVMDMLNLSKYEEHERSDTQTDVSLKAITREVFETLRPSADERGVSLLFQGDDVSFLSGREDMRQLIKNLVENAIQYNERGGHVSVSVEEKEEWLRIEVTDDGIGIPEDDRKRIFERFYRVDKARSKKTGGTGLGLSIVKHIVLGYGGTIDLVSEEGQGTSVTVFLPIDKHM